MSNLDLAITFPSRGVICLRSRSLFGDADNPAYRLFVERVFLAEEISNVTISAGSCAAGRAALLPEEIPIGRRCQANRRGLERWTCASRTHDRTATRTSIRRGNASDNGVVHDEGDCASRRFAQANGHALVNGHAGTNGRTHANGHEPSNGHSSGGVPFVLVTL